MPRLWSETIDAHRRDVRAAIVRTAVALVGEHGLRAVTMSRVAEATGIGRATLYRYFPDVESILTAWHSDQVTGHLARLEKLRSGTGNTGQRLSAVLEAYAHLSRQSSGHHDAELVAWLHRGEHLSPAHRQVRELVRDLLREGAAAGEFRRDVAPAELAAYCLHAMAAAAELPSRAAVKRLVAVIETGVRSDPGATAQQQRP